MKSHSYINCSTDQLIRSAKEEEYFRVHSQRLDTGRFTQRSPSEVGFRMGPEDIALPYPLQLTLHVEGQIVKGADVEIGWQHQGLEKSMEQFSWMEAGDLLKRVDPNPDSSLGLAYRLAVEKLFGVSSHVSDWERYVRIAKLESERVFHHLHVAARLFELYAQSAMHDAIRDTVVFSQSFRVALSKSMKDEKMRDEVKKAFEQLKGALGPVIKTLRNSKQLKNRLEGRARMDLNLALSLGLTGIYLRGAGHFDDLRSEQPDLPYLTLGFQPQVLRGGDAYTRFELRLLEIENALVLIERALSIALGKDFISMDYLSVPDLSNPELIPQKSGVETVYLESPEGEMAVTVCSDGKNKPYRVRIKTPSFALTSAISSFLSGCDLDDVIVILHSLGINPLQTDR